MKKGILAGLLFVLVWCGAGTSSDIPTFPFVFVSGQAEQEVAPDLARVSFGVHVLDENAGRALSLMGERSAELMAIFHKYAIEDKDIVAYEISKEAVRERKENVGLKILGYDLTRRMSVTVRKLDRFDALMTELVGLKNVVQVQTVLDTTRRKEIEADLFRQAAQKARESADLLARGFGSEVASVHAISVSPWGFGNMGDEFGLGPGYRGYGAGASGAPGQEKGMNLFVPATIKLQEAVSAIFRLK